MSDDQLMEKSYKELKSRRYLIVIDDIWSTKIWDLIARALPDDNNGSRIILTTRLNDVAEYVNPDTPPLEIKQLSSYESLNLLFHNLFGAKNNCRSELEEIGKEIVGKCQGLPLAIIVVAGHLSKVPMTKESWDAVAKNVSKVVASYPDKCLAVLAMSYHHLPIHLKPCFLHIGIFPEDSDINIDRLIRLWVAERFLKWDRLKSPEEVANDCLEDLISRNLVMVRRRKSDGNMKTCGMHDLLRDLCVSEAQKEKFLDVIKINQDPKISATNHMSSRLSLQSRISLENFSNSSQVILRSLYLFDEPPIPAKFFTLQFKALRVLSVVPYKFSSYLNVVTVNSAILRYLEVKLGNRFPLELSFVCNMETFSFYDSTLGIGGILPLPSEIWKMKQLRHLYIRNSIYLPNPPRTDGEDSNCDLGLQNLEELSSLCLASCTKEVFNSLPNLRKLRIYDTKKKVEGLEDTSSNLLNLAYLNKLENLRCFFSRLFLRPLTFDSSFPVSLKKYSIYGGGFPWKDMASLAKLPNLQVLKLGFSSFTGSVWELNEEDQFNQLEFLMLDNLDLKHWEADSVNFPNLRRLVLQGMYCQIPLGFGDICTLKSIELHKCGFAVRKSAREIQEEAAAMAGTDCLDVRMYDECYDYVKNRF